MVVLISSTVGSSAPGLGVGVAVICSFFAFVVVPWEGTAVVVGGCDVAAVVVETVFVAAAVVVGVELGVGDSVRPFTPVAAAFSPLPEQG
jgi:hypothetical protein